MRTCRIVGSAVPANHWVKLKESEKKDKYLDLARELKMMVIPIVIGARGSHQRIGIRTTWLLNKRTTGDHPNYSIVEIGQNIEKSPVTQTSAKDHQLTHM